MTAGQKSQPRQSEAGPFQTDSNATSQAIRQPRIRATFCAGKARDNISAAANSRTAIAMKSSMKSESKNRSKSRKAPTKTEACPFGEPFRNRRSREWQRSDWKLLQNSPIALYYRAEILTEDLAWLRTQSYVVDEFDCCGWGSEAHFHTDLARRLAFPDYYGCNLNALKDFMGDIDVPDSGGRAVVLRRFDTFAQRESAIAYHILDITALTAWRFLLIGRRLLILVQSDDTRIVFDVVGAHPVIWNPREWLNKNRGL